MESKFSLTYVYIHSRELGDSLLHNLRGPSPELPIPVEWPPLDRTPSVTAMATLTDSPHSHDLDQVQL